MISLFLIICIAASTSQVVTATASSSSYVYPRYALRYVPAEDYKQQTSLNGVTSQAYSSSDQQGYVRYVTYTTDGTNVYQNIIRAKPGAYPSAWSTLLQSRMVSAANDDNTEPLHDSNSKTSTQTTDVEHDSHGNIEAVGMSHPSEETVPPISKSVNEENQPKTTASVMEISNEDIGVTTTDSPKPEESKREIEMDGIKLQENAELPDIREEAGNAISEENNGMSEEDDYSSQGTKVVPQYVSSPYGPIALYPLTYNPYAVQMKQLVGQKPVSSSSQTPSVVPTMSTYGDKSSTLTPTTRPPLSTTRVPATRTSSSVPLAITSGSTIRLQPISYVYPYLRYQSQNTGVVYQVPQQQVKSSTQYLRWSGVSQPTYQSTYPQGYFSYQPGVIAVRSVSPSNQRIAPKMLVDSTMHTFTNSEK